MLGGTSGASTRRFQIAILIFAAILAMVVLRLVALESDAFPSLSWSSALLTDEGFYIHNARNVVLFGTARTDQFNNMLIMPTLHAIQVAVFRVWGVGIVQARMIPVVASLATLPLLFFAVDISLGRRSAVTATLFLGLDHVYLLYNRLALMDSPAASVLIIVFCCWVTALRNIGWKRSVAFYCCGVALVVAYSIRGLVAPLFISPFVALWLDEIITAKKANTGARARLASFFAKSLPIAIGLGTSMLVYMIVWYVPNRGEITRVNHYYFQQLMPLSFRGAMLNLVGAVFGTGRGITPYLMRHTPIMFLLVVSWIVGPFTTILSSLCPAAGKNEKRLGITISTVSNAKRDASEISNAAVVLAVLWLLTLWAILAITQYSPSRYYVLTYPAMAIVAAHALTNLPELLASIVRSVTAVVVLVMLVVYHFGFAVCERLIDPQANLSVTIAGTAAVAASCAALVVMRQAQTCDRRLNLQTFGPQLMLVWLVVNIGWTMVWLGHLTYRQRDADTWLGEHLPSNSVLIGAVAPGLCINNRFRVVNVIQGLCNDVNPVAISPGAPKYILILDDSWRETWWISRYPTIMNLENRIKTFPHLLRPRFVVGVYRVNNEYWRPVL